MARIKYSALVTEIAGSIGGTTFQRNAYGYTVKNKPNIVNPASIGQRFIQNEMSASARQWQQLTNAQRTLWSGYAQDYPIASRLNPSSFLNGYNYFVQYHINRKEVGSVTALGNPYATRDAYTLFEPTITRSGPELIIAPNIEDSTGTYRLAFYLTRPIPGSQQFIQNTPRWLSDFMYGSPFTYDIGPEYQNTFGFLPQPGDRVGFVLLFLKIDGGQFFKNSPIILPVF